MARDARSVQTDIDRITEMMTAARVDGNVDTMSILEQAQARLEGELERLTRDSRATRQASIDEASAELIEFENEARVSADLKAEIQNSRGDLVRRREAAGT